MDCKKILIVGKETFMYPFYFAIKDWSKYEFASFWINPLESELDEVDLNSSTYYEYKRQGIKIYTLKDAVRMYDEGINFNINELEKKYSYYKNFNRQIISDQMMSVCYHTRHFNIPPTYEQQLLWTCCVYKNIEYILDDFKPDAIFDCDIAELPRTILNEVAHKKGIPYISIEYSRYQMYKIPSYTLNLGVEGYFANEYQRCLEGDNAEEVEYVKAFRKSKSIKNKTYLIKGNTTYAYSPEPLIDTLKSIYGRIVYFIAQDKPKKNKKLKKQNPVLFVNSWKYIKFWVKSRMYRRWLYRTKNFFEDPVDGEPYVYMPLHLIPESTTYSLAPFWINELTTIEAVSKSLPAGWRLYVKEHQAMLGERSKEFYIKVKQIPNVRLVRFNYYDDPKPWIEKSRAVVTITGTSAYEAALLGKPAFVFGDVPFALIKGVTRVREIEKLPQMLQDIREIEKVDNIKECAAYIKTVKNVGKSIDLESIMNKAYANLTTGTELDDEFWKEIKKLKEFFEHAFEHAYERMEQGIVRL